MRVMTLAAIGVLGVAGCTNYQPLPQGAGSWEEARRAAYGAAPSAASPRARTPEPRVTDTPVASAPAPVRDEPVAQTLEPKPLPPLRTTSSATASRDTPAPPAPVATAATSEDRDGEAPAPTEAASEPLSEPVSEPAGEEPASESGEARVAAARPASPTATAEADADASLPPPALSGVGFLWPVPAAGDTVRVTDIGDEGALAIVSPADEPFVAAENGVVVFAGDDLAAFGRMVVVRHDGDYTTAYGHAERLDVAVGDVVRRGQRLGLIGSSGEVTTPQLYFEMRVGSRVVDPRAYLVEAPRLVAEGS